MQENVVIVDIDGTIAKVGDRVRHLQETPPNWDKFYERCDEDEPIKEIIDLVKLLNVRYTIVFLTGRRESVRLKTRIWLTEHFKEETGRFYKFDLLMRPDGDKRHDTEMKPEILQAAGYKFESIAFVLEDRNSMVQYWRSQGILCLQVADGDF